jgi:hypothetical protein
LGQIFIKFGACLALNLKNDAETAPFYDAIWEI